MAKERRELKYVAIDDIMSNKLVDKIIKTFDKRVNKNDTYNEFEKILKDSDLKPFRCGTNRYVFSHKKYKHHVVKIAADMHGIRANRREFYNASIHERLTQSLSISPDGHILVQEKIEPITEWRVFQEYWKKIDKLLWDLHEYFLVVDLSMTSKSMGNFGLRKLKNGDVEVVACDHGDIVPYEDYQIKTVDLDEELLVSLRCRNTPNHDGKECKGHLEPHGNWEFLKCDKCKKIIKFHEAYRDIVGDIINGTPKEKASYKTMSEDVINEFRRLQDERDKLFIKNNIANNTVDKNKEDTMSDNTGLIIDGYCLPKPRNPYAELVYNNVLNGISTVQEYFDVIDEDMNFFKVQSDRNEIRDDERESVYDDYPEYVEDEDENIPDTTYDEANPNAENIADVEFEQIPDDEEEINDEQNDDDDQDEIQETGYQDHQTPIFNGVNKYRKDTPSRMLSFDDDDDDGDEIVEDCTILDYPLSDMLSADPLDMEDVKELIAAISPIIDEFFLVKNLSNASPEQMLMLGKFLSDYNVASHLLKDNSTNENALDIYDQIIMFYELISTIDSLLIHGGLNSVCETEQKYFISDIRPVFYTAMLKILYYLNNELNSNPSPLEIIDNVDKFTFDVLSDIHLDFTESGSRSSYIISSIVFELPRYIKEPFDELILDNIIHKDMKDLKSKLIAISFEHAGKIKSVTIDLHTHIKQLINHNIINDDDDSYIIDVCGLQIWDKNADEIDYDNIYSSMYNVEE